MSSTQCPYCGYDLNVMPQRKRKCPSCKQPIYSKYTPENRVKRLMTEKEARGVEKQWSLYNVRQTSISVLYPFGYDGSDIEKERARGAKTDLEAIVSLLNNVTATEKDLHKQKIAYFTLANIAAERGKDTFRRFLMAAHHCELLRYKQQGGVIKKVQIAASGLKNLCPECQSKEGRILDIDEALKTMPLPCRTCTCTRFDGIIGFCGCSYLAYSENWV